jgi:hypothetical protein
MGPPLTVEQVASAQIEGDYAIKSENVTQKLNTSQWPLLLKNYDKLLVRSGHFTPIPSGSSPLKRDISTYIKYASFKICPRSSFPFQNLGLESSTLTSLQILPLMKSLHGLGEYSVSKKQVTVARLTQKSLAASSYVSIAQRD